MMTLEFDDLSPYAGELSGDDDKWLAKVARIDPRDYRIGIEDDRPEDDEWLPLIERGRDGRWWAGQLHRLDDGRGSAADRPAAPRD
jgi:hypothetical protein